MRRTLGQRRSANRQIYGRCVYPHHDDEGGEQYKISRIEIPYILHENHLARPIPSLRGSSSGQFSKIALDVMMATVSIWTSRVSISTWPEGSWRALRVAALRCPCVAFKDDAPFLNYEGRFSGQRNCLQCFPPGKIPPGKAVPEKVPGICGLSIRNKSRLQRLAQNRQQIIPVAVVVKGVSDEAHVLEPFLRLPIFNSRQWFQWIFRSMQ